jgi:uncharacterized protein (DUF58 family)
VMSFTRIATAAGILVLTLFVVAVVLAGPFGSTTALIVAVTIAALIAAGSLLYGRDSHGAAAVERDRPAQEAADQAAALAIEARRATAEAAKRGERYCPLDPAHRPHDTLQ